MARRSRESFQRRQRERARVEKAARKRQKRLERRRPEDADEPATEANGEAPVGEAEPDQPEVAGAAAEAVTPGPRGDD
jgi:hypothetical protein